MYGWSMAHKQCHKHNGTLLHSSSHLEVHVSTPISHKAVSRQRNLLMAVFCSWHPQMPV